MSEISYVTGDATRPVKATGESVVIAHVVNDVGAWGRGFVLALSREDDTPERWYRRWHAGENLNAQPFALGSNLLVPFGPTVHRLWVANMIAQRGWRRGGLDPQALDLAALETCLSALYGEIGEPYDVPVARVVMPRIGCGLGGGRWVDVEPLVQRELADRGVDVTVYSLPEQMWRGER